MVQFNFSERTIKAKVVYYGPAQSGKTTNLEQVHRLTDPGGTNRLISLNTAQDRTLFFDLLPFSLGAVAGYDFKVQLYTVPGQVQYNATRRVVLAGADAVVFVADSRRSMAKENQAAFENMKVNLLANRLVPEKVPLVVQFNKQDLPDLIPEAELQKSLNPWGRPSFGAVGAEGKGVLETFVAVVTEMLGAIAIKYNLKEKGLDPASVPAIVGEAFASVLKQAEAASAALPPRPAPPVPSVTTSSAPSAPPAAPVVPNKVVLSQYTDSLHAAPPQPGDTGLVSEELLHRSIRSNVELAEALGDLVREMNLGLGSILSHAELLMVYREDAREKRLAAIQKIQDEATRLRRIVQDLGQGQGGNVASAPPPAPPPPARATTPTAASRAASVTIPGMQRPADIPPPAAPSPQPPPVPVAPAPRAAPSGFEAAMLEALSTVRPALESRGLLADLRVPPGTPPPRCPPETVQRALTGLLTWVASVTPDTPAFPVRCEKKPVLLKSREGEVRRDFLMVSLGNAGAVTPEDQQRIMQGIDPGLAGQSAKAVREMGGFLRFAPLPGGGIEVRVFMPAA
jgi:signal recognition particle receptor subunit beta